MPDSADSPWRRRLGKGFRRLVEVTLQLSPGRGNVSRCSTLGRACYVDLHIRDNRAAVLRASERQRVREQTTSRLLERRYAVFHPR